ncbi:hypothetical protein [Nocardia sp. NPDC050718]|uniref:hypothetical protein n=1 Tax=unclassified Nocardia TaxID=2637762 RepID=UPI003406DA36
MPRNVTPTPTPGDSGVVCWPEPSPLDDWWTEIMDGVTPTRAHTACSGTTCSGEHGHPRPTPPSRRGAA